MKQSCAILATIFFSLALIVVPSGALSGARRLHVHFYRNRCPQAEQIVAEAIARSFARDMTVVPSFIRLLFHDCFVTGCDASLLLDSTPYHGPVEKASPANGMDLKGLDIIDDIKAELERVCPDTVSCSDILAFAAREAAVLSGLPYFNIPAGRRDGRTSNNYDVFKNLPFPTMPVDDMIRVYAQKGLSTEDLVVLAGAHSIGSVHCKMFDHRLFLNFTSESVAPIEPVYAAYLRTRCPEPELGTIGVRDRATVNFDPDSPGTLDNMFYVNLLRGRGLLQSDQVLASDPQTAPFVRTMAFNPGLWSWKFVHALIKLGKTDVLTGREGEIRRNCRVPN